MKSNEQGVLRKSEVYFSSPSQTAKKLYYYPISAGHFFCVNGYHLIRKNYNSLLITHILDGNFTYVKNGKHTTAHKGDTVILDCYNPHEYYTENGFETIWIHVSGSNSYELFEEIEKSNGTLIKCKDIHYVEKLLFRIYDSIKGDTPPNELRISVDIYKLFAELLNFQTTKSLGKTIMKIQCSR